MNINITGDNVDITEPLRAYVTEKLQRIHNHFQHINNVYVVLSVDKKYQQKAEARIHVPKAELFAEAEDKDMYAAIDILIDRLDRQVVKHKDMMNHRNPGDGSEV